MKALVFVSKFLTWVSGHNDLVCRPVPALSPGPNLQHNVAVVFRQRQAHWRLRLVQNLERGLALVFVQNLTHRTQQVYRWVQASTSKLKKESLQWASYSECTMLLEVVFSDLCAAVSLFALKSKDHVSHRYLLMVMFSSCMSWYKTYKHDLWFCYIFDFYYKEQ